MCVMAFQMHSSQLSMSSHLLPAVQAEMTSVERGMLDAMHGSGAQMCAALMMLQLTYRSSTAPSPQSMAD